MLPFPVNPIVLPDPRWILPPQSSCCCSRWPQPRGTVTTGRGAVTFALPAAPRLLLALPTAWSGWEGGKAPSFLPAPPLLGLQGWFSSLQGLLCHGWNPSGAPPQLHVGLQAALVGSDPCGCPCEEFDGSKQNPGLFGGEGAPFLLLQPCHLCLPLQTASAFLSGEIKQLSFPVARLPCRSQGD